MNFKIIRNKKQSTKIADTLDSKTKSLINDLVPSAEISLKDNTLSVTSTFPSDDWAYDLLVEQLADLGWGFVKSIDNGVQFEKVSQSTISDSIKSLLNWISPKNNALLKSIK